MVGSKKDQILYRALAEFSDACDIPELTPACPYYQLQADGSPVCGEECKDILGDDLSHVVASEPLSLGSDLAASVRTSRRPRPRRSREHRIAFDARQIYFVEHTRSVDSWSMTSLIKGLQNEVAWMTLKESEPDDRLAVVEEISAELARRGVDVETLIRQGLYDDIAGSIYWHLRNSLPKREDGLGWVDFIKKVMPDFDGWALETDNDIQSVIDALSCYLPRWLLHSPMKDVMSHRITADPDELLTAIETLPPRDHDAVWLVERFTTTFLEHWSSHSLEREWRYIHTQRAGCCPPGFMRERAIDLHQLALLLAEIGARHVSGHEKRDDSPPIRQLRVDQFLPLAISALEKGDRAEAVSIYRMIRRVSPEDRQVNNNLGFCVLPDDPQEGADLLESAIAGTNSAGPLLAMTYLNLALARLLLHDYEAATKAIELASQMDMEGFFGWMWDLEAVAQGYWVLKHIVGDDLRLYADDLEQMVAASAQS
ncbi:hypothetical protein ACQI4L_09240 [Mycolicibacterium litorale]|uniref:hypothetical protein n=1 Tax=Mycolicibacterium litorale TaxID=758802 RepID=UPI003CF3E5B4